MEAFCTALFTGQQNVCTGGAFRVQQGGVLLDDQGVAQGHHEQNAQNAAAQGDQGDLQDAGLVAQALFCPQEQCGHGEDGTGGQALACGTDGLHHVALQNGVLLEQDADHAHRNDCCRDGGRNSHADAQAQISVCSAEDHGQDDAHDHRGRRHFCGDLFRRNIRLEGFLIFHVCSPCDSTSALLFGAGRLCCLFSYFLKHAHPIQQRIRWHILHYTKV